MKTNWRLVLACIAVGVVAVLVGYVTLHNHAPFTREDYAALLGALVFFTFFVYLLLDVGSGLEMRLPRHFRTLGHGFGLFDALQSMLRRIDEVRKQLDAGTMNESEAAVAEGRLFESYSKYFADRRWKQVDRLRAGREEDAARELARSIARDHGL